MTGDALEAVVRHVTRQIRAEDRRPGPQAFVDVLGDRIVVGGHVIARPGRAHLVLLHHDLGIPLGAVKGGDDPGVLLGQGHEIAIVVVADILVVDLRQSRSLVLRAHVLAVMFDDHVHAVRVVAQHHHQHHVRKLGEDFRVIGGCHPVGENRQALARADLAGVHRECLKQEDAAIADQLSPLVRGNRRIESEALVDSLELVQAVQILRGGDERYIHRPTEGRCSDLAHLDPIGRRRYIEHVIDKFGVVDELTIAARHKTEHALRASDLGARLGDRKGGKCRTDQEQDID